MRKTNPPRFASFYGFYVNNNTESGKIDLLSSTFGERVLG